MSYLDEPKQDKSNNYLNITKIIIISNLSIIRTYDDYFILWIMGMNRRYLSLQLPRKKLKQ